MRICPKLSHFSPILLPFPTNFTLLCTFPRKYFWQFLTVPHFPPFPPHPPPISPHSPPISPPFPPHFPPFSCISAIFPSPCGEAATSAAADTDACIAHTRHLRDPRACPLPVHPLLQDNLPAWDFRCKNVLSISASGHKFGQSVCGTGWVVWRQREELSEHVAVSVSYLGGKGDSYTLNFSRPASGVYVQFYKFNRLGLAGYRDLEQNMMTNAKVIRDGMKRMTKVCARGPPPVALSRS